ncbi:hypothetical protein BpHYR1_033799, partial [Brachionus plicatilis]
WSLRDKQIVYMNARLWNNLLETCIAKVDVKLYQRPWKLKFLLKGEMKGEYAISKELAFKEAIFK